MRPRKAKQVTCEIGPKGPEATPGKRTAGANYECQSLVLMDHLERLRIQLKISISTNTLNKI